MGSQDLGRVEETAGALHLPDDGQGQAALQYQTKGD